MARIHFIPVFRNGFSEKEREREIHSFAKRKMYAHQEKTRKSVYKINLKSDR